MNSVTASIAKPEHQQATSYSVANHNKQLTRIITQLRDRLRTRLPQLAMPSQWMIRQLIDNATIERDGIVSVAKANRHQRTAARASVIDWREEIVQLLGIIHRACDVGLEKTCTFIHTERMIPLFPNNELFDEWDTYRFTQALLHYLEKESSSAQ